MTGRVESVAGERGWSGPAVLLRVEGLAVLVAAVVLYGREGFSWWMFALLLLAPDLAIVPYMVNQGIGRVVYNLVHSYSLPIVLGLVALLVGWGVGLSLALIWLAHIGMDRMVGYGLKYGESFKVTHLQRV